MNSNGAFFAFDAAELCRRVWSFGPVQGSPYNSYITLLPDGRLGGHDVAMERRWAISGDRLVFFDWMDRPSTVFTNAIRRENGRVRLIGDFVQSPQGAGVHRLDEVEPAATLSAEGPENPLIGLAPGPNRRNLVVVRANEHSLHRHWWRDLEPEDRSWDLCVSFYGSETAFEQEVDARYKVLQNKDRKCQSLYRLFSRDTPLWAYDYICIADDDLMTSWSAVNELFAICREYRLELAQPALTEDSYVNYPLFRARAGMLLRYVSFVEFMMPVFTVQALKRCAPTFDHTAHGFGIDNVWPKLLGEPKKALAVVDKIAVSHTRPLASGQWYDLATAVAEGNEVQRIYNAPSRVLEYGFITA